ncbi:MAG: CHAD domain-containing protein [Thermodesulfobacteriota bacterium]
MQPLHQCTWSFPDHYSPAEFHLALTEQFDTLSTTLPTFQRTWFDTFDYRLFQKKQLLVKEGSNWILQDFQGAPLHTVSSRIKHPFSQQFPKSGLRDTLQGITGIRALIELVQEEVHTSRVTILNRDQKVVAILILEESLSIGGENTLLSASLQEVRGYEKRYKAVVAFLRRVGASKEDGPVAILRMSLERKGRSPLDYSSAYNVPLEPTITTGEAVSRIYLSLLNDIRCNEQGVIDDLDTEFLHDLRVAVRRTRTALSMTRATLSDEDTEHFKQAFRHIGRMSSPVRDLDVYLLSEDKCRARLPERLQEGLDHFFNDLAERREKEQKELVSFLGSQRYRQTLLDWERLFDGSCCLLGNSSSTLPVIELANRVIRKRFQRVLRDGRKIHPGSPDSKLHLLRIQCKKLRYGLEFFSSLHDPREMKQLIGCLKKLQNNLGDFNDLSVQQEMLAKYLTGLRPGSKKSRETAASIGGLMTDMAREHRLIRSHFEETFSRFSRKDNLDLYAKLFN